MQYDGVLTRRGRDIRLVIAVILSENRLDCICIELTTSLHR